MIARIDSTQTITRQLPATRPVPAKGQATPPVPTAAGDRLVTLNRRSAFQSVVVGALASGLSIGVPLSLVKEGLPAGIFFGGLGFATGVAGGVVGRHKARGAATVGAAAKQGGLAGAATGAACGALVAVSLSKDIKFTAFGTALGGVLGGIGSAVAAAIDHTPAVNPHHPMRMRTTCQLRAGCPSSRIRTATRSPCTRPRPPEPGLILDTAPSGPRLIEGPKGLFRDDAHNQAITDRRTALSAATWPMRRNDQGTAICRLVIVPLINRILTIRALSPFVNFA
jgi:hypothetical protein